MVGWWRGGVARAAYVVAGAMFGCAVSLTSPHRGTERWTVWAAFAVALAAVSGGVFGYGLARWPEVAALGHIRRRRVAAYVSLIAVVGAALLVLGEVLSNIPKDPSRARDGDPSGLLLVTFAGIGAVPVGAGLAAIWDQADTLNGSAGEQVEDVLTLRRLLAGFLAALGAQVTLATLALGAVPRLDTRVSSAVVIVFGAAYSVVVAVAYAPAAGALRRAARALCRRVVPLADVALVDLPARAEDRRQLEHALGVDRGLLTDLQTGVVVLAPLLASAAAMFLPD